jgi:hypothetical protein
MRRPVSTRYSPSFRLMLRPTNLNRDLASELTCFRFCADGQVLPARRDAAAAFHDQVPRRVPQAPQPQLAGRLGVCQLDQRALQSKYLLHLFVSSAVDCPLLRSVMLAALLFPPHLHPPSYSSYSRSTLDIICQGVLWQAQPAFDGTAQDACEWDLALVSYASCHLVAHVFDVCCCCTRRRRR